MRCTGTLASVTYDMWRFTRREAGWEVGIMTNICREDRFRGIYNPTKYKLFFTKQMDRRLKDFGLSEGHVFFLMALDDENGRSLKEITDEVDVHKSLTTRMMKNLIENGFAVDTRESGKEYSVVLTDRGKEAKEAVKNALNEVMDILMGNLSEQDADDLYRILQKLQRAIDEAESGESVNGP